ncbi:MAG: mechanosensitive ion channel [Leptolyngbya sp. SIO3F4]|nr:mechanosensitive ion channel [Leptolyngbya sp. SIO3F4]
MVCILLSVLLSLTMFSAPDSLAQGKKGQASTVQDENISTAWIGVDGQRLFEVAETQDLTARQRAQGINAELTELMKSSEQLSVNVDVSGYTPIIYNGFSRANGRQLLSVTAGDLRALDKNVQKQNLERQARLWAQEIEAGLRQARVERSETYLIQAAIASLAVLLSAVALHYLLGYLWRRYVSPLLPEPVAQPLPGSTGFSRPQFSLARFSAHLLLLLLRVGVWLSALLFVVKRFRVTRAWANQLQDLLVDTFVNQSLPLGGATRLSIADLLALLGWLGGLILLAKIATNVLRSRLLQTSGLSLGMQAAIAILVRYAILFFGIIAILQLWGIDLSSLTLLASALGVGLGLGLQNIAKDISSGLVLVFERPIQVGDFIELNGQMGMVDRIGPRSTDIRTLDQISIIVPNSRFLEHDVINWSHRNPLSRIHIPVGVAYETNPETVKAILLEVGREHPQVMAAPAPEVFLTGFGDSSLNFELLVWIRKPQQYPKVQSDLNFAPVRTRLREIKIAARCFSGRSAGIDVFRINLG